MDISILKENILKLKLVEGIGNRTIRNIIQSCEYLSSENIEKLDLCKYLNKKQLAAFKESSVCLNEKIISITSSCRNNNIGLTFITDDDYPLLLKSIHDAPVLLYYKGQLTYDSDRSLAVVGSRKCTRYGQNSCRKLMEVFGNYDLAIISGLAIGIDTIAHKAALDNNCKCIGVVGQGLNHIYPSINKDLYQRILDNGGCIFSETVPDEYINNRSVFVNRNRIISGLAKGTLIVEAARKSGSLSTARFAFEENREVFALPGDINRSMSSGCNDLIKSNTARLVICAEDIIKDLGLEISSYNSSQTDQEDPLVKILMTERCTSDDISFKTGKSIYEINALLSELELTGMVSRDESGCWSVI